MKVLIALFLIGTIFSASVEDSQVAAIFEKVSSLITISAANLEAGNERLHNNNVGIINFLFWACCGQNPAIIVQFEGRLPGYY